ncbi:MAG: hypothetical protein ACTSWR_05385 [Candidatus Helarchaeota archaeon]
MYNKIIGSLKISENGICKHCSGLAFSKKELDFQLFSSFLHVFKMILHDYLETEIKEINTSNYKIIFNEVEDDLYIYIVNKDFSDYSNLEKYHVPDKVKVI